MVVLQDDFARAIDQFFVVLLQVVLQLFDVALVTRHRPRLAGRVVEGVQLVVKRDRHFGT